MTKQKSNNQRVYDKSNKQHCADKNGYKVTIGLEDIKSAC